MKFTGLCFLLFFLLQNNMTVFAQTEEEISKELKFINHLLGRQNNDEALFLLENLQSDNSLQQDTIYYLTGWTLYNQKALEASAWYLAMVSRESSWFEKSNFFAAYNLTYLGEREKSLARLNLFDDNFSREIIEMKNFQLAGISLLDRRLDDFQRYSAGFTGKLSFMAAEEEKLVNYYERIKSAPNRSPFLAGLMSAAVPGMGRIYAGKTAEGIAGFLYVGAMLAATYDFYNRLGSSNPFFLISAGLSGIFYIGNIWGSVISVQRVKNEFNYEMDQRILLDIHIPLRKLFP
ncbi:MAG: hypothetical protein EA393_09335 [Bacteroidetes bacterium]|nr:MAG: hypothetical protein EA393_09335 [Bacteroidota bacterium]